MNIVAALGFLFAACAPANAALILMLNSLSISGQPGELVTLTGSLQNTGPENLTTLNPASLTSTVLLVDAILAPAAIANGTTYTGAIVTFRIHPAAAVGSFPVNTFSMSYDSDTGRTNTSNSLNLDVTLVPEPSAAWIAAAGLAVLGPMCRLRRRG